MMLCLLFLRLLDRWTLDTGPGVVEVMRDVWGALLACILLLYAEKSRLL